MKPRTRARLAAGLYGWSAVQFLLAEAVTAANSANYRYAVDTVSELGEPTRSGWYLLMNSAFAMSAASVLVAGLCSVHLVAPGRKSAYLAAVASYSIGSLVVATVHSGDGNTAHVVGAVLAIGAGNVIALVVGTGVPDCPRWYSNGSVALGVVGFVASGLLVAGLGPVGAVERASIYTFVAWEVLTAVTLSVRLGRRARTPTSSSY